jgi:hypothetical protein
MNKIRDAELTVDVLGGNKNTKIISQLFHAKSVKLGKRFRLLFYSKLPWLISLIFLLKHFNKNK